jgi:membrane-associated phospholipid phosphatase
MDSISKFISIAFHPLLLATYLFALFAWLYPPALFPVQTNSPSGIILLVFISTCILPVVNIYFFKAFGTVRSMHMNSREERIIPFSIISLLYVLVTYLLHNKTGIGWQDSFMKFLLIIDAVVICSFLFTLILKISIHAMATSAIVGIVTVLNNFVDNGVFLYPMLVCIILAGVVMTARLYLQAHTLREVVVGALVGLTIGISGMVILF